MDVEFKVPQVCIQLSTVIKKASEGTVCTLHANLCKYFNRTYIIMCKMNITIS